MTSAKLIERPGSARRNARRPVEKPETGNAETAAATVKLQRTPAGSITVWVEAPDGVAGGIELESLDQRKAGARGFVEWAKEQLGRRKTKSGAKVELELREEGTILRAKSQRYAGALNLDEIELDARVLRWAKACLRPPARKRRPVKALP
jgi:hypothetical protein